MAVTGYEEALAVYKDPAFSSCVVGGGTVFRRCRSRPGGSDDIRDLIEQHRAAMPMAEHVVTMDAEAHAKRGGC